MECVDATIARKRHSNYVSAAISKHETTEELLEAMFAMWSMPRLYSDDKRGKLVVNQSPASKDVSMDLQQLPLFGAVTKQ